MHNVGGLHCPGNGVLLSPCVPSQGLSVGPGQGVSVGRGQVSFGPGCGGPGRSPDPLGSVQRGGCLLSPPAAPDEMLGVLWYLGSHPAALCGAGGALRAAPGPRVVSFPGVPSLRAPAAHARAISALQRAKVKPVSFQAAKSLSTVVMPTMKFSSQNLFLMCFVFFISMLRRCSL